jgi:hypothetical protein
LSNEYLYNPETGNMDELDTSEKPALEQIGERMFGELSEAETKLLADLSELGLGDCKYKLFAFKGHAQERGWKSPVTPSDYLSWLIWSAQRDATAVKTNASFRTIREASYNAASSYKTIYELVTKGVQPTSCKVMTNGNLS